MTERENTKNIGITRVLILSFWVTFWKNWADLALTTMGDPAEPTSRGSDATEGRYSLATHHSSTEMDLAERARVEFLANMNHDLRTPLNAVIGFAQIIEKEIFGEVSPQYLEYAKHIQESGYDLLAKIEDILDQADAETAHAIAEKTGIKPRRAKRKAFEKELAIAD